MRERVRERGVWTYDRESILARVLRDYMEISEVRLWIEPPSTPVQRHTHTHTPFSIALCLRSSFGRCMSVCATCVGGSLEASASLFLALLPSLPLLLRPLFSLCCFPLVRSRSFTVLPHNSHLVAQSICALSLPSLSISLCFSSLLPLSLFFFLSFYLIL